MFRGTWWGTVDKRGRLFIPAGIRKNFEAVQVIYIKREADLISFYAKEVEDSIPTKIRKRYRKNKRWEMVSSVIIQIPKQFWIPGEKAIMRLEGGGHYFSLSY